MSLEQWAWYAFKFDRCQRLEPKLRNIRKEIDSFWRKHVNRIRRYHASQERGDEALATEFTLEIRKLLLPPEELRSDRPVRYFDGAKSMFLKDMICK